MLKKQNSVHKAGALGKLLSSGKISTVEFEEEEVSATTLHTKEQMYKTETGIIFHENELISISPKSCKPWKFANRSEDEMHDISFLISSIKNTGQLQPILVRPISNEKFKYEVIFGRQRLEACLQLNINVLAIEKSDISDKEAALLQYDENNKRSDVSMYSEAKHFEYMLSEGVFKSSSELMNHVGFSKSSFYDLMTFNKIPNDIVMKIPKIHELSVSMSCAITRILGMDNLNHDKLLSIASNIGVTITSPSLLGKAISLPTTKGVKQKPALLKNKNVQGKDGHKLFNYGSNSRGALTITLNKKLSKSINEDELVKYIKTYLENSGAPEYAKNKH